MSNTSNNIKRRRNTLEDKASLIGDIANIKLKTQCITAREYQNKHSCKEEYFGK